MDVTGKPTLHLYGKKSKTIFEEEKPFWDMRSELEERGKKIEVQLSKGQRSPREK